MSLDMFPDEAIKYLLENARGENLWMEHAIAHHSNKVHDDFYDMIGEDLYHLHSVYYPNCHDELEYYIPEPERPDMLELEVVCVYYDKPVDQAYITPWSESVAQLLADQPDRQNVIYYHDVPRRDAA